MTRNIVEELKEGERLKYQDESSEQQEKIEEEIAEEVQVHQLRKAPGAPETKGRRRTPRACRPDGDDILRCGACSRPRLAEASPASQNNGRARQQSIPVGLLHSREQNQAQQAGQEVGSPHARSRREAALAGKASTADERQVVPADQHQGHQRSEEHT